MNKAEQSNLMCTCKLEKKNQCLLLLTSSIKSKKSFKT